MSRFTQVRSLSLVVSVITLGAISLFQTAAYAGELGNSSARPSVSRAQSMEENVPRPPVQPTSENGKQPRIVTRTTAQLPQTPSQDSREPQDNSKVWWESLIGR